MRFGEVFRFFDAWEEEREDGSVVDGMFGAAEGEAALVAIDDAGGDPEAEAGAVEVFGGVEGLEEAGADGGDMPWPVSATVMRMPDGRWGSGRSSPWRRGHGRRGGRPDAWRRWRWR